MSRRLGSTSMGRRPSRLWPELPRIAGSTAVRESSPLLSDPQWRRLASTLAEGDPAQATRRAMEGVLWVLRTGAPWSALPKRYPSAVTCRRRWRGWMRDGRWLDFWRGYVATLDPKGWEEWTRALARSGRALPEATGREDAARQAWWLVSARVLYCESRFTSVAPVPTISRRTSKG